MRICRTGGDATLPSEVLAKALGLFSIGLGAAGLARPRGLARFAGIADGVVERGLLRAVGAREIGQGLGILTQPQPTGWLWSRVAGDLIDVSFVGFELMSGRAKSRGRGRAALAALLGITAVDLFCATRLSSRVTGATTGGGTTKERGKQVITVAGPVEEAYRRWRDFASFPRFMRYVEEVRVADDRRSHWRAAAPWGGSVEWDAEITEDRPNELIAWRSLPGSQVHHTGRVRFRAAPAGRGTVVEVELRYEPPAGGASATVARLLGREPRQLVADDLRRFKQLAETGEVTVSDATMNGNGMPQRPGRPAGTDQKRGDTLVGAAR
jgi:uncharacterized membrane protein